MTHELCVDLDLVASVLIGVAALGLVVFAVLYTWKADWRRTPLGRHMFYFSWAFVFAYVVAVARQWFPGQEWFDHIRLFSLTLVILTVWQRVWLLAQSLREEPPDTHLTHEDQKGDSDGEP